MFAQFLPTAFHKKQSVLDKAVTNYLPLSRIGPTCSCGPCYNNATCIPTGTKSFKCMCRPGFQGTRCRIVYTISFGEDAYLEMTNNYLYDDEVLSFEFKTTLPDGLLLYQEGVSIYIRYNIMIGIYT